MSLGRHFAPCIRSFDIIDRVESPALRDRVISSLCFVRSRDQSDRWAAALREGSWLWVNYMVRSLQDLSSCRSKQSWKGQLVFRLAVPYKLLSKSLFFRGFAIGTVLLRYLPDRSHIKYARNGFSSRVSILRIIIV